MKRRDLWVSQRDYCRNIATVLWSSSNRSNFLLQAETFVHQALEARFVEDVVGEFFVGEHG